MTLMTTTLDNLFKYQDLDQKIKLVEKILSKNLENDLLSKTLMPLIKAKSKHLRPFLMLLVGASQNILEAASAVEMLHIASLIHDDIMDEANERRGVSTINKLYGDEQAILAGDYLLTKALIKISEFGFGINTILMQTFLKLCQGQSLELKDNFNLNRTKKRYLETIQLKTAELFGGALEIAAHLNNYTERDVQKYREFGLNFGLMFQIMDDLSDYFSSEAILSKPTFNDLKEGNYSYPILILLEDAPKDMSRYLKNPNRFKQNIIDLLVKTSAINKSLILVQEFMIKSQKSLYELSSKNPNLDYLINFPSNYLNWSVDNLFLEEYKNYFKKLFKDLDVGI